MLINFPKPEVQVDNTRLHVDMLGQFCWHQVMLLVAHSVGVNTKKCCDKLMPPVEMDTSVTRLAAAHLIHLQPKIETFNKMAPPK